MDTNFDELYTNKLLEGQGIGGGSIPTVNPNSITKNAILGGASGVAGGPVGFITGAIISTIGSILGAFAGPDEPQLTPEQAFFQHLVQSYHDIGERTSKFSNLIHAATGVRPQTKSTTQMINEDWDSKIQPVVKKLASKRAQLNSQVNNTDLYGNKIEEKEKKNANNV